MSFFGKLRGNTSAQNSSGQQPPPSKKSTGSTPLPTLEELIARAALNRQNGNDKLFGFYNPNTTCYFNSIVQCLYFSDPFREQVMSFPSWVQRPSTPKPNPSPLAVDSNVTKPLENGSAVSPNLKPLEQPISPTSPSSRTAPSLAGPSANAPRAEENKESFDYKKKQVLANGPVVQVSDAYSNSYGMKESLFTGLKDVFEIMVRHDAKTGVINPSKFIDHLRSTSDVFRPAVHHDAHEFLMLLLNDVADQVENFTKDTQKDLKAQTITTVSWIHDMFGGLLTSEIRCLTCESISQSDEPFLDLSLDLENNSSISSCLRRFSAEEMLCERDKFHCDKCGDLQEAEKRMKIKKLPKVLAIHLKRFKYVDMEGRMQKLFHRVVYPFTMRLMNTTDECEDPDRLYELYAVVVHLGSTPVHGHYVSIIKTKDHGWLLFDDELVLPVSKHYVQNFFGDIRNPAAAYILFYQEVNEDIIEREQDIEDPMPTSSSQASTPQIPLVDPQEIIDPQNIGIALSPVHERVPAIPQAHVATTNESGYSSSDGRPTSPPSHVHPFSNTEAKLTPRNPGPTELPSLQAATSHNETQRHSYEEPSNTTDKSHAGKNNASLARFKPTSMSLRHKPKFWGSRDKPENGPSHVAEPPPQGPLQPPPEEPSRPMAELHASKSLKIKGSRFGLGRKKSTLGGS